MTTAIEAVNFAKDLANQGKGVDFDGYYGKQCVDLPNWICGKFFGKALWGNAIDLLNSAEQHGFDVHRMPTSERPHPGALFVKSYVAGDGIDYGHTGIIIDVDGDTVQTVEQNLVGDLSVGGPAQYASQRIDNLVGWFYPPYADSGQSEPDQMMEKTDEELAQEVIAGFHGFGEERKHSLGSRYDAVQTKVNEILNGSLSAAEELKEEPQAVQFKEDEDLSFNGAILKKSVLDIILRKCKEHDILPSYAITVLHFEGLWGTSSVGKADNNWGGMTWTGKGERPSGVTVTKGSARPSNEGGHYMHYASVDDFLTDWFYLLRSGGSYKVSGAKTFSEAIKGMFKTGGAVYDYAASGFDSYIVGASSRLKAIESENGSLDKFDKQIVTDVAQSDKIEVNIEGIEISINGVTYELTKKPV